MRPFGARVALDYCGSAVVMHWARRTCVLSFCENACGCLGLGALATEGLLSWRTGHGPNAF